MAWQSPIANTTATTSLGTANSLYVATPIVIAAVTASGSDQQVVVDGTIAAATDGIWFQSSAQSGNSVIVHDSGVVRGHTSTGIAAYSSDSSLVNKGYIFGDSLGVLFGGTSTTTTSTLNNSGTIESSQYGAGRYFGAEAVSVTNTGTISGNLFSYGQYSSNPVARDLITNRGQMIGDVDLGAGNDLYDGSGGRLTGKVLGGAGDDVIRGGLDNDNFEGGDGNDVLDGGKGADTMRGGTGDDTYVVDNAGDIVDETGGSGVDTVQSSVSFSLANTARAKGSVEHLTLTGSGTINATGNALTNTLTGNTKNNVLDGGKLNDTMKGLAGNDTYRVDHTGDIVDETGGSGIDTVQSSVTFSLANTARVKGAVENLTLTGSGTINATGNKLANVLTGNSKNNRIEGGEGQDTMTGGGGNDTFVFRTTKDSGKGSKADVIRDFDDSGNDRIDLSAFSGKFKYMDDDAFTGSMQVRVKKSGSDVIVEVNTGGSRTPEFEIKLTKTALASMGADDFLL